MPERLRRWLEARWFDPALAAVLAGTMIASDGSGWSAGELVLILLACAPVAIMRRHAVPPRAPLRV